MTRKNLAAHIDALGQIKAQIAALKLQEDALKEALAGLEPGSYEGNLFRLAITDSERETLDMEAVRAHLSRQFIQAHTRITEVRSLRVSARTGKITPQDVGASALKVVAH